MHENFIESFKEVSKHVNYTAKQKGWWDIQSAEEYESKVLHNAFERRDHLNGLGKIIKSAYLAGQQNPERNEGEMISLMHSELSEALEGLRNGTFDDKIESFRSIEAEFADVIIRIMDHAEEKGYRVAEALVAKIEFNETRPYKHGGKKF